MWKKDFPVSVWSVVVIGLSAVGSSAWKPIAPPAAYYAQKASTCGSDCDLKHKYPFLDDAGGSQAETQLKSTLLTQPIAFNQAKDYHQSNQKLDLDIFKPTEVTFFPADQGKTFNSPLSTYQEVLRKTPTSYFSFKTYGVPQKPTKTIYYGDFELAKPKLTSDLKYYKAYKQSLGPNSLKIFKPGSFVDNEVASHRPLGHSFDEHCSLYKVSFRQDFYYQYIQYKVHMPELKEFTLCLWSRFHNHSYDHSLFSYATKHHPKAIYMWVSNLNDPGFFNMKVMGQTIFRLNYPIKLYHWYHTCQSWNGNTGEWQVWVNSHRIARGYHNLLVGHSIPGGGMATSGQEHRNFGKGYQEIPQFLKGSGGLEGEITMLQMYKVALTAGKAYNDHSHHHSHYTSTTPEPPELPTEEPSTTTDHPFLENGQLKKHVNVLDLAEALRNQAHLEASDHQPSFELYGDPIPFHPYVAPLPGNTVNYLSLPSHAVFKRNDESKAKTSPRDPRDQRDQKENPEKIKFLNNVSGQIQVEKIKYSSDEVTDKNFSVIPEIEVSGINATSEELVDNFTGVYDDEDQSGEDKTSGFRVGRTRLRRHHPRRNTRPTANRPKRITPGEISRYSVYRLKKNNEPHILKNEKPAGKRHIVFEDPYFTFGLQNHETHLPYGGIQPSGFSYDQFQQFAPDFSEDVDQVEEDHEPEKERKKEMELAEGEVKRVMEICSGCHLDPFRKVAVISWRTTPKKIFSGALFLKAKPECDNF